MPSGALLICGKPFAGSIHPMGYRPDAISQRLKNRKDIILEEWIRRVQEEIPESRNKDKEAIRNTIPVLLEKITHTLSIASPKHTAELEHELVAAKEHGEQRATFKNYSLQQVIHEYQLLRKVIFEVLEDDHELEKENRDVILDAISLAERFAAAEFFSIHKNAQTDLKMRTDERNKAEKQRDHSRDQVNELIAQRGAREIFVSTLAHDLRNPITAARMNIELLIRRRNESGALEIYTGSALSNLSRLEGMIQDLLDANHIKTKQRLPIKISQMEMNREIREILDAQVAIFGDRFEFEPIDKVEGYWDRSGIRRIVENLCSNAIKYGDPTLPITVSIQANRVKKTVTLSVQNWGPLISPEDQKFLFDPFRRATTAETKAQQGWGIGLALVRGMAESHGGNVRVQSLPETGNIFAVTLPMDARPIAKEKPLLPRSAA
jgi:signal transduction histidine kinase